MERATPAKKTAEKPSKTKAAEAVVSAAQRVFSKVSEKADCLWLGGESAKDPSRQIEAPDERPQQPRLHVLAFVDGQRKRGRLAFDVGVIDHLVRALAQSEWNSKRGSWFRRILKTSAADLAFGMA